MKQHYNEMTLREETCCVGIKSYLIKTMFTHLIFKEKANLATKCMTSHTSRLHGVQSEKSCYQ